MSYKATNWAYELELTGPKKFVLVALADMADEANSCYPGQKKLASMTGFAEKTIRRALVTLESDGLLSREERHGSFGYRTSDRYTLNVGKSLPVTKPTGLRAHRADSPSLPVTESIPNGLSDRAVEPSVEPLEEPPVVPPSKKGTRIPEPFIVTGAMRAWASKRTPDVDVDLSTEMFVNYWRAKTRDATKRDWPATWNNWLLSDQGKAAPKKRGRSGFEQGADLVRLLQERESNAAI